MSEAWDYDERVWDFERDGYRKVVRWGNLVYERPATPDWTCELCGLPYTHFFVSNKTWARVAEPVRGLRLCTECFARNLS